MKNVLSALVEVYDNIMYLPHKVFDIFKDFYGEERVDLQGFKDFEDFVQMVSHNKLKYFFSTKGEILDNPGFLLANTETRHAIAKLIDKDNDLLEKTLVENNDVIKYILPLAVSKLSQNFNDGAILVHFPKVRVTNEHDKFIDITHLWVRVGLKINGKCLGGFSMNRSEYTASQLNAGYLHSHVPSIGVGSDFSIFRSPCLGSGPIKDTIATLAMSYDEPMWKLFCLELDKYVRVESLSGVPYKYLEKVNDKETVPGETDYFQTCKRLNVVNTETIKLIPAFARYLINNPCFEYNFVEGSYGIAMPYTKFRVFISNKFIEWYNEEYKQGNVTLTCNELISYGILRKCIIEDEVIKYVGNSVTASYNNCEGNYVCNFKGENITLHIVDDIQVDNYSLFLDAGVVDLIIKTFLTIINYKYGRQKENNEAGIDTQAIYI